MRVFRYLLLAAAALVAVPAVAQQPTFPRGGAVGLVPPAGMVEAAAFAGFEDGTRTASILLAEMPVEAYAVFERQMTADRLKGQGIVETAREAVTLPGGIPAVLVTGTQAGPAGAIAKWVLFARGAAATALVTGQIAPQGSPSTTPEAMRAALLTVAVKTPPPIDEQLAALPFELGALAGFRPVRTVAGNAVYLTEGPKDVDPGGAQPVVVIARSMGGAPAARDVDAFARHVFGTVPGVEKVRIERAEPQRVRGLPGHEIRAEAVDDSSGAPVRVVQWLRLERGGYVRVVAFARVEQFDALFGRFRAVRDGVELR